MFSELNYRYAFKHHLSYITTTEAMIMQRKIGKRVAIISCEPDNQEPMSFRGKQATIREILRVTAADLLLEPIMHRPVSDINDFPVQGEYGSIIIGGSKLNLFDEDIKKYEWMKRLLGFIREVHGTVPILGICYGHQAIGSAFGATLKMFDNSYEVGYAPIHLTEAARKDPLFRNSPSTMQAMFSHFSYVSTVPEDATVLADSRLNKSLQAFRVGEATWGIQFHPEYTAQCVRNIVEARRDAIQHLVDVDYVLRKLDTVQRHDLVPLRNFAKFVLEK
jgi:GMP synthase (glutamine-hydrolysing)